MTYDEHCKREQRKNLQMALDLLTMVRGYWNDDGESETLVDYIYDAYSEITDVINERAERKRFEAYYDERRARDQQALERPQARIPWSEGGTTWPVDEKPVYARQDPELVARMQAEILELDRAIRESWVTMPTSKIDLGEALHSTIAAASTDTGRLLWTPHSEDDRRDTDEVEAPKIPKNCYECAREMSETLDAYYGDDPDMALLCDRCRTKRGRNASSP